MTTNAQSDRMIALNLMIALAKIHSITKEANTGNSWSSFEAFRDISCIVEEAMKEAGAGQ